MVFSFLFSDRVIMPKNFRGGGNLRAGGWTGGVERQVSMIWKSGTDAGRKS